MRKLLVGFAVFIGTGKADPRTTQLESLWIHQHSPLLCCAQDFLDAADYYQLDWRLLPSIAWVESSSGKHEVGNNPFGWNGGKTHFKSFHQAIWFVAWELARGRYYRNKSTREKIHTYNPRPQYRSTISSRMSYFGVPTLFMGRPANASNNLSHAQ